MRNLSRVSVAGALLLCFVLFAAPVGAQQWGDVSLRFVYDGAAPAPVPANVTKDLQFCGKHNLVDESLAVNRDNNGIANVILFIRDKNPPVHPSYAKDANAVIDIDNANCRFKPHVVTLRTSQTLQVGNSDPVGHNSNFTTYRNPGQNILIPAQGKIKLNFPTVERLPAKVSCNIHPWMSAWLVIQDHPYMAASDKDGKITLKNVPTGQWTFQAWQEKAGYVRQLKQNGVAKQWKRGTFKLTVKKGKNDLGEIKVPPALFK